MRRTIAQMIIMGLVCGMLMGFGGEPMDREDLGVHHVWPPFDGLSVSLSTTDAVDVRAYIDGAWGAWTTLQLENEQDPRLHESSMVLFPTSVVSVQFRGAEPFAIHPIRVSQAPARYAVASTSPGTHRILSRTEWGADESLRFTASASTSSASSTTPSESDATEGGTLSQREKDCRDAYAKYPDEFVKATRKNTTFQGKTLRWPEEYSRDVRLFVVHHTALAATGETRSGLERMRALYQYHAQNRAWGDVGYHYVIDDDGQIYEGHAGGQYVIGGHAYCNNVGTIGIALMGNFDEEQPTQPQAMALQWLLRSLADQYQVDLARDTVFHGKRTSRIVGHRDLLSTDCPGFTMWSALDQIRSHASDGRTELAVRFPEPIQSVATMRRSTTPKGSVEQTTVAVASDGLAPLSDITIDARPGSTVIIPVYFRAPKNVSRNARIARIVHTPGVEVAQERDGTYVAVRGDIKAPSKLAIGQVSLIRLKVSVPMTRGSMALRVGSIAYTIESAGKSLRGRGEPRIPTVWTKPIENPLITRPSRRYVPSTITSPRRVEEPAPLPDRSTIRIHLTQLTQDITLLPGPGQGMLQVTGSDGSRREMPYAHLSVADGLCQAENGEDTHAAIVRFTTPDGLIQVVRGSQSASKTYRGIIECRADGDALLLINELPLEQYMLGIAEEPDTELYQKQRAFAIAARSYAAYYIDVGHRKFLNAPYDGSDSPAEFQLYSGKNSEDGNPRWVQAVQSTAGMVLTYRGELIKPPYFSSDDGRTRSPTEAGWKNYPAAEILSSKSDPWCSGMSLSGHGVGMSGCGAKGQAQEGKSGEQILSYYYPGTSIVPLGSLKN
jgi:hypothetical protein